MKRRHDIPHDNIQHNDIQHNNTLNTTQRTDPQHNGRVLLC
jgi:hypothetical protein